MNPLTFERVGPRVRLRPWRDDDRAPFAALNADPDVMQFLPATLSRAESDAMIDRMQAAIAARGWGNWCLDIAGRCVGFVGLSEPMFEAHFTPCVEIGWRLARSAWGLGYATEAARLVLDFAFGDLKFDEIVSFTTVANLASRRVMERIGMTRDPADDFDHLRLPAGHPLRPHVLYRIARNATAS
jgi:RimJ/RimL family protein N-acetyltransferase